MKRYSGFGRLMLGLLLLNLLLVATHKGEFWPFSIFPKFSQAGNPWSRAVVERVDDPARADLWRTRTLLDAGSLRGEHWMVNQVRGRLTETDSVIVESTP